MDKKYLNDTAKNLLTMLVPNVFSDASQLVPFSSEELEQVFCHLDRKPDFVHFLENAHDTFIMSYVGYYAHSLEPYRLKSRMFLHLTILTNTYCSHQIIAIYQASSKLRAQAQQIEYGSILQYHFSLVNLLEIPLEDDDALKNLRRFPYQQIGSNSLQERVFQDNFEKLEDDGNLTRRMRNTTSRKNIKTMNFY